MTNLLSEPVYITLADARDTSTTLSGLTNDELNNLICQAQFAIDNYIGFYGVKADEDQLQIFPTEDDDIPDDIKVATVRICEQIYLEGNSLGALRGDKIVSEGNLSRSVTYSNKQSHNDHVDTLQIPKKALKVLNKYKNSFISQVI